MKIAYPGTIQPPRIPKRLPGQEDLRPEDGGEYTGFSASACDWSGLRVTGAVLEQALLRRANLTGAHFIRWRMSDLRWEQADGAAAEWETVRIKRSEFIGSRLLGQQWIDAELEDVRFAECNLEGALFINAGFREVHFEKCKLHGCTFENCRFLGVDLRNCDLRSATLHETSLEGVDLRGAQLDGMQLRPDALRGAVITPDQAVRAAALLGVRLLDENAGLEEEEKET